MISDSEYKERYYRENGQVGDRPALMYFVRLARRYIAPGAVLDFGCGSGHLLKRLSRHFDALGVEASDWARENATALTGKPVHASVSPVPDESLSGIVSIHVVEHIPDLELRQVLAEWRRILKPGGTALVVTPDKEGYAARVKGRSWIALTDPTHINLKGHAAWIAEFEAAGFECVEEGADGLWDFPYALRWLGRLETFIKGWPTLAQFALGRLVLQPGSGESSIFVLRRT